MQIDLILVVYHVNPPIRRFDTVPPLTLATRIFPIRDIHWTKAEVHQSPNLQNPYERKLGGGGIVVPDSIPSNTVQYRPIPSNTIESPNGTDDG